MTTVAIANIDDDGYWYTGAFSNHNPRLYLGDAGNLISGFFRFAGLSGLTLGATVGPTTLRLHGYGGGEDAGLAHFHIHVRLANAAGAPASESDLNGYTWSTTYVDWPSVSLGTGWATSPDFSSVVQEAVDAGFDLSSMLVGLLCVSGGNYVVGEALDDGSGHPPDMTYSATAGPSTLTPPTISSGAVLYAPTVSDPSLMSSPPTVTYGTSTVLSSPVTAAPTAAAFANLGHRLGLDNFSRYMGLSITPNIVDYENSGDALNATPFAIEFDFTGQVLEFSIVDNGATWRLMVDGLYAAASETALGTTYGTKYLSFDFGSSATRRIRLETSNTFGIIAVRRESGASFASTGLTYSPRMIVLGDSYTEGQIGTGNTLMSWVYKMQRRLELDLGWKDVWASGSGGTGYLNNSGAQGRLTYRGRSADDVIAYSPDYVLVAGGYNDTPSTQSAIEAEAELLFAALTAGLPSALVIALGPWCPSGNITDNNGNTTTLEHIRDAVKTAAAAQGVWFVDNLTGQIYDPTGAAFGSAAGQWITTTSAAWLTSGDGVHPTLAGHEVIGYDAADAVEAIVAAVATLTLPTIGSGAALYAPSLGENVSLPAISAGSTVTAPTVQLNIVLAAIGSGAVLYAPQVTAPNELLLPFVGSSEQLYAPTVALTISLVAISSAEQLFAPTALVQNVALGTVASGSQVYAPSVSYVQALTLPMLSSGAVLHAPTVALFEPTASELERALAYRAQQNNREAFKLAQEQALRGSEAARLALVADTAALLPWAGWEPVRRVKGDESGEEWTSDA